MRDEPQTQSPVPPALPDEVVQALDGGHKVKAIKLLRLSRQISLKQSKDIIDEYCRSGLTATNPGQRITPTGKLPDLIGKLPGIACFLCFIWMAVNIFVLVGSLIILLNLDEYSRASFQVTGYYYTNDYEAGELWWLEGRIGEREVRLADSSLIAGPEDAYQELRHRYPPDTVIPVWYNAGVTDELFQHRTLNVIPYTDDPAAEENRRLRHWVLTCLLPFLALFLVIVLRKKTVTTVKRPP